MVLGGPMGGSAVNTGLVLGGGYRAGLDVGPDGPGRVWLGGLGERLSEEFPDQGGEVVDV